MAGPTNKKVVPWDEIEPIWRQGIQTKTQIATAYGLSRQGLDKHFLKLGISRDLAPAIAAETEALLARSLVTRPVTPEDMIRDQELIDIGAATQTGIILRHRRDIGKLQSVVGGMIYELTAQAMSPEELLHVAELVALCAGQEDDKEATPAKVQQKVNAFNKLLGLSNRADTLKKVAESLKALVGMERQAFGLSDNSNGDANTPDAPKPSDNETARRVAFVLANSLNVQINNKE